MKILIALALPWPLFVTGAAAQPAVDPGGIVNAASNSAPGLPNSGIAQGSLFIVFGQNLGPANLAQAGGFPLAATLAGTSVQVTVGSTTVNPFLVYTTARQLAAILPSSTPVGDGTLTVTYSGRSNAPAPIRVAPRSFGIFTRNQNGSGPAIVQNVNAEDRPVNALNAAAHPEQFMILWGTGLGPIPAADNGPPPIGTLSPDVDVLVGTKHATPTYAGRSGCCAGVDQIVFQVPADVELGCYVPLAVSTGGVVSNFTTLSISVTGDACSDSTGLSAQEAANLATGGSVRVASINLSRFDSGVTAPASLSQGSDEGSARFARFSPDQWLASVSPFGSTISIPSGTCVTFQTKARGPEQIDPISGDPLDAGSALSIAGATMTKSLPKTAPGMYTNSMLGGGVAFPGFPSPPSLLVPGAFTVNNGSGGPAVGPFSFSFDLPGPVSWTNPSAVSGAIARSQDLTITWSGGDPTRQFVAISGVSMLASGAAAGFECRQTVDAGSFTVPSRILSALPVTGSGPLSLPLGSFFVGTSLYGDAAHFEAPGIDIGRLAFTEYFSNSVRYQ